MGFHLWHNNIRAASLQETCSQQRARICTPDVGACPVLLRGKAGKIPVRHQDLGLARGGRMPSLALFLRWGKHHDQISAHHLGFLLCYSHLFAVGDDSVHNIEAELSIVVFPPPEIKGTLDPVALFEEFMGPAKFGLIVIFSHIGMKFDLFDLARGSLGIPFLLPFFVLILPIIHDTADGRFGGGSHFNQIEPLLDGDHLGFFGGYHSQLAAIDIDEAHLRHTDQAIDPRSIPLGTVVAGPTNKKPQGKRGSRIA